MPNCPTCEIPLVKVTEDGGFRCTKCNHFEQVPEVAAEKGEQLNKAAGAAEAQVPTKLTPEQSRMMKVGRIAEVAANMAGQMASWAQSAQHCAELGDLKAAMSHLDIAEGYAANLATMMAATVDWKATLGRMRESGSKPPVALMLANVSKELGTVAGATWWGKLDASAASGQLRAADVRQMTCVVIPIGDPDKGEGPKIVLAR